MDEWQQGVTDDQDVQDEKIFLQIIIKPKNCYTSVTSAFFFELVCGFI